MTKTIGDELLFFNEKLEKLFTNLSDAEITFGINSPEYLQIKDYIVMTNKVIERKMGYFDNFDNNELLKFYTIFSESHHVLLESKFPKALANTHYALTKDKTINDIKYYYWINNCLEEEMIYDDEEYRTEILTIAHDIIRLATESYTAELLFERLFSSTLLDYVRMAIERQEDIDVRNSLIRIKNRLIYYYNDLQRLFIEDEHYISATAYYQNELVELLKKNYDDLEVTFLDPLIDIVNDGLKDIEQILESSDLKTPEEQAEIIFKSLYIKTALSINYSKRLQNIFNTTLTTENEKVQNKQTKKALNETFSLEKALTFIKN